MRTTNAALLLASLALLACYKPPGVPQASVLCGANGACPQGLMCVPLPRDGGTVQVCCSDPSCGLVAPMRPDAEVAAPTEVGDAPGVDAEDVPGAGGADVSSDGEPPTPEPDGACPMGLRSCGGSKCLPLECCQNSDCPADPGGAKVQCVANKCFNICPEGTHRCDDKVCASNSEPATCGSSCTPCPVPGGGGSVTCDGTKCVPMCPAGKKLCMGDCLPEATICEPCRSGTHECRGSCLRDDSPASCGTSCEPCKPPPEGVPTCEQGKCGFVCNTNFKKCGDLCIPASACCTAEDCRGGPKGATPVCLPTHVCQFPCPPATHLCGDACVSNSDPATCGMSCTPCEVPAGGQASCDGMACVPVCPAPLRYCGRDKRCKPPSEPCNGVCDQPGSHACPGDRCVSDNDVNSCGQRCDPCPVPPNGSAICNAGTCDFICPGGKRCDDRCIPTADCCRDADCPAPTGGSARCNAGTCVPSCPSGQHQCGSACVSNSNPATCGASCTPCPAPPANAMAGCDGTRCVDQCLPNHRRCSPGSACFAAGTDSCCSDAECTGGPEGSIKRCVDNRCSYSCPMGTRNCSNRCLSDTDPANCGGTCMGCPPGFSCSRGTCMSICPTKRCPQDTCVPNDGCCAAGECSARANAVATCSGSGACSWTCNRDYIDEGGACINRKEVPCDPNNDNPPNSNDVARMVTIHYSTASGWTRPARCDWTCAMGFQRTSDGRACVATGQIYLYALAPTNGNIGGRAGVDRRCRELAPSQLTGVNNHVGFIGVTAGDGIRDLPATRGVPMDRPIVNLLNQRIADNWADLTDWTIQRSLSDAQVLPRGARWWSGVYPVDFPGVLPFVAADATCSRWTTTDFAGGHTGDADATNHHWAHRAGEDCWKTFHTLCLAWRSP